MDLLHQLQDHQEFSTLRIVYIHNVRMESGSFVAYDSDNNPIQLPPGLTGIPSLLSVTSNMAKVISGGQAILTHYGLSENKIKKFQPSESELAPKAFLSSSSSTTASFSSTPTPLNSNSTPTSAKAILTKSRTVVVIPVAITQSSG
jgi:hypothetical protein